MPLTSEAIAEAAEELGVSVAVIRAVDEVESRGRGYFDTGEPKILFERHVFYRRAAKKHGAPQAQAWARQHPNICNKKSGGYIGGAKEHERLHKACDLDYDVAIESASWGRYQIMGFHWERLGYDDPKDFQLAMYADGERKQLEDFVTFIKTDGRLHAAMKRREWHTVARLYNGPAYRKNRYHAKLRDAYEKYSTVA